MSDVAQMVYIEEKLEEALASLRGLQFNETSLSGYARVLDARMALAGAQGALEGLRKMKQRAA